MKFNPFSKSVILATILAVGSWAFAGDNGGGNIECSSASGRTKISGGAGAPYNGTGPASLNYSLDHATVELNPSKLFGGHTHLVDFVQYDHEKSYAVTIIKSQAFEYNDNEMYVNNSPIFQLRSVGKLQKVRADVYRFKAIIPAYSTIDPRVQPDLSKDTENFDKDIQVDCTLDVTL